ncbi:MAG: hypothetical protein ACR2KX_03665 [Chitinophagaceae bacterium]
MQKTKYALNLTRLIFCFFFFSPVVAAQNSIQQFGMYGDVKVSIHVPKNYFPLRKTIIILYALPNGMDIVGEEDFFSYLDGIKV